MLFRGDLNDSVGAEQFEDGFEVYPKDQSGRRTCDAGFPTLDLAGSPCVCASVGDSDRILHPGASGSTSDVVSASPAEVAQRSFIHKFPFCLCSGQYTAPGLMICNNVIFSIL